MYCLVILCLISFPFVSKGFVPSVRIQIQSYGFAFTGFVIHGSKNETVRNERLLTLNKLLEQQVACIQDNSYLYETFNILYIFATEFTIVSSPNFFRLLYL